MEKKEMVIAVCDDEEEIRKHIAGNIRLRYPDAKILLFRDGKEVLSYRGRMDILFLDIQMGEPDGISVARLLRKAGCDVTIIFVTAIEEYVFLAFDVNAFHYLVKPIREAKFFEVLRRAVEERQARPGRREKEQAGIAVKSQGITRRILLSEIFYVEVFNRIVIVHTEHETIEFYGKLVELEKKLTEDFVRCHRSYIVNLSYVSKYNAGCITLDNGQTIPLSQKKYSTFVRNYMEYTNRLMDRRGEE